MLPTAEDGVSRLRRQQGPKLLQGRPGRLPPAPGHGSLNAMRLFGFATKRGMQWTARCSAQRQSGSGGAVLGVHRRALASVLMHCYSSQRAEWREQKAGDALHKL